MLLSITKTQFENELVSSNLWSKPCVRNPVLLATKDEISEHNSATREFSNGKRQPLCR